MKLYLLQLGSLTLFIVGLPLLYAYWCYQNYNKNVKTVRQRPRFRRTRALAEIRITSVLEGDRL